MRITINDNNEITGYAIVGGIEGDFEIDDSIIPQDFTQTFKPKYYLYQDKQIIVNPNYQTETYEQPTTPTQPVMSDDTLKYMVATLQKQSVQSNMKINKLLQDNQSLKAKVSELENKEVTANE